LSLSLFLPFPSSFPFVSFLFFSFLFRSHSYPFLSFRSQALELRVRMCVYYVLIRCAYTMCLYDVLIRCAYPMCLYDVLTRCAYTMCLYDVLILYAYTMCTLCAYTMCLYSVLKLCTPYEVLILCVETLYTHNEELKVYLLILCAYSQALELRVLLPHRLLLQLIRCIYYVCLYNVHPMCLHSGS
jgi:hypothetical protein